MAMQLSPDAQEKQDRILSAAIQVFSAYGVRRASMEDIARAAGMSRAALYQHFRNKEDILAHGITAFFRAGEEDLRAALAPGRPLAEAVRDGCLSQAGPIARALLDSPHGEELLALKHGDAGDKAEAGFARIVGVWAEWLHAEDAAGRLRLTASAQQVAETILAGLHGLKMAAQNYDDYRARIEVFAALMADALRP